MLSRLRQEKGFGLVELLIAMTVLNIGIFAILASFNAGIVTLQRASRTSTAATLADTKMEDFRAIKYDVIAVGSTTETLTGPDGRSYEVETSVVLDFPRDPLTNATIGREYKRITIVVKDVVDASRVLARETSTFDRSTGS